MKLLLATLLAVLAGPPKEPDVAAPGGLWERLGKPRTGEWRDVYDEPGQTFSEYRSSDPVRATHGRARIYLLPLLTRPPEDALLLDRVGAVLGAAYGAPVATMGPRALPRRAYRPRRRQFSIPALVPMLLRALPEDALFVLAVTDRDLYIGDMGFTYGWGSFQMRVGVMSIHRLRREGDERAWRRRLISLAVHEAGHMLSMRHCAFYPCVMNGARSLAEADRRPLLFCPVCLAKVCWNRRLDRRSRYAALEKAYLKAGLEDAAREIARALAVTRNAERN